MGVHKTNLIAAVIIAILVFFAGIVIGNWVSEVRFEEIRRDQDELDTDILDFETHYAIAQEDVCDANILLGMNQELDAVGKRVSYLESKGLDDDKLLNIGKRYFLIELKHWMYIKQVNEECNSSYPWIFYFYRPRECAECTLQSMSLTNVKAENPEVMIYSFNINTELRSLDAIKQRYDIKSTPSLVINGVEHGYLNEEEILNILNLNPS